ncbi:MAG TPA: polysaccharide deacetylase family protein [Candidatus Eisenbacteria bacterium]|nr:polysaccharide deacetylase family protein [Candidatus Eisenbacteria bacterium]
MSVRTQGAAFSVRLFRAGLRRCFWPVATVARALAGAIRAVETSAPVAALTFDDGPSPDTTPRVLEILRRHRARGTFFMVGEAASLHPELVAQVVEEGHAVGSHTWSHASLPMLKTTERLEEIRACEAVLPLSRPRLFRPPYGHQNWPCRCLTLSLGYEVIAFSVHAEDWLDRSAPWMARRLVDKIRPGSIVVLHDRICRNILASGKEDRSAMIAALDQALDRLAGRFAFVTVPELLRHGPAVRENWYNQPPPELRSVLGEHVVDIRRRKAIASEATRRG